MFTAQGPLCFKDSRRFFHAIEVAQLCNLHRSGMNVLYYRGGASNSEWAT